jgi:DNA-binding protein HU-beta
MNKNELIEAIAAKTDSSKAQSECAVRALQEVISETLAKGESITLPGFGTFEARERGERTGRNPRTGEELKIAASRVPAFKPSTTLKAAVNGSEK